MPEKVIGLLGGMGPESTAALLVKITRSTPVEREQDHLRVIVDSNPKIPDRTAALVSGETGAVIDALVETARNLERAGADVIGIPCNTAHAFLSHVSSAVHVPVLDMISETAFRARDAFGRNAVAGVLATVGTLQARLYHEALGTAELATVVPPSPGPQDELMQAIHSVKLRGASDDARELLEKAIGAVEAGGATALIAGCTEVSLLLEYRAPGLPWLDPMQILAEALVREAQGLEDSRETPDIAVR